MQWYLSQTRWWEGKDLKSDCISMYCNPVFHMSENHGDSLITILLKPRVIISYNTYDNLRSQNNGICGIDAWKINQKKLNLHQVSEMIHRLMVSALKFTFIYRKINIFRPFRRFSSQTWFSISETYSSQKKAWKKKERKSSNQYLLRCRWKVRWSSVVYKTFLKPQSKTVLQCSPK